MEIKEIKKTLEDHEKRIRKLEGAKDHLINLSRKTKEISLIEFMKEKNPMDDLQKTLCIGFFLEQNEGIEPFTSKDIEGGFRKARLTVPQNVADKINQCIKKGWIAEDKEIKDGKKTFYITISGQNKISEGFRKNG